MEPPPSRITALAPAVSSAVMALLETWAQPLVQRWGGTRCTSPLRRCLDEEERLNPGMPMESRGMYAPIQNEKIPYWKPVRECVSSSKKRRSFLGSRPAQAQEAFITSPRYMRSCQSGRSTALFQPLGIGGRLNQAMGFALRLLPLPQGLVVSNALRAAAGNAMQVPPVQRVASQLDHVSVELGQ